MCLHSKKIRVNNTYIGKGHYQPLYIEVPCGECAECLQMKQEQWYLRNYWHCKNCFDKNGYVLFDTLTYRDADLRHLSDFFPELSDSDLNYSCFSYEDICNFMKRLRINLSRGVFEPEFIKVQELKKEKTNLKKSRKYYPLRSNSDKIKNSSKRAWIEQRIIEIDAEVAELKKKCVGFDVKSNLDSFVVCEYGSEDYYRYNGRLRKRTFRPHYHLLFYVTVPNLDCVKLADYIYRSWKHGKTDCCNEYGVVQESYTRMHNCIGKYYKRNAEIELRRVASYVAKYITKDPWYSQKIKARIASVTSALFWDSIDNLQKNIDEFKRTCVPQKFNGIYGRYSSEKQEKLIDDLVRRLDGFHLQGLGFGLYGIDPANLDMDELVKDGTFSLPDKDKIVKHIPAPMYYVRKLFYNVYKDFSPNGLKMESPSFVLKQDKLSKEWKKNSLLRGRDAMYNKYNDLYLNIHDYDKFLIDFYLDGRDIMDYVNYKFFYQNRITDGHIDLNIDNVIDKLLTVKPFGKDFDLYLDDDRDVYERVGYNKFERKTFDEFAKENIINMWSHPCFIYFDWLDDIFAKYIEIQNKEKQETYERNEEQKKIYRMQGIKCKK